jgi:hypothetical protein
VRDLGFATTGSGGTPQLTVTYANGTDLLGFTTWRGPASSPGLLVLSGQAIYLPVLGSVLVPGPDLLLAANSNSLGAALLSLPVTVAFPGGATFYAQHWFIDLPNPGALAVSNALEFELIR